MPFLQSENPTVSRALCDALLAALSARPAAALLTTPKVHLFTAGPSPITPASVPADFTEATFAGYAEQDLPALSASINLPANTGFGVHAEANFEAGAVVAPGENVLGYWVDDGAAALYLAEYFPSPVPISSIGDFVSLDVIFGALSPTEVS